MTQFVANNGLRWNVDKLNALLDQPDPTVSGTGVTGSNAIVAPQTLTLTVDDLSVTMTDATTAGSHGSQKLVTFPAGNIHILGATTNLTIARVGTALAANSAVVGSLGSVTVATDNATLTSTEANIVPSTTSTLSSGSGVTKGESTGAVTLDGTTSAVEVYLNFATPDAGSTGNDALLVNGTIVITYVNLGDN
jgi:hypothetical protein